MASFAREWLPLDTTALVSLGLLLGFDLVTPEQAIAGFSNPAVVTVLMMFILSDGLVQSGLVRRIGYRIAAWGRGLELAGERHPPLPDRLHLRLHQQHGGGVDLHPGGHGPRRALPDQPVEAAHAALLRGRSSAAPAP